MTTLEIIIRELQACRDKQRNGAPFFDASDPKAAVISLDCVDLDALVAALDAERLETLKRLRDFATRNMRDVSHLLSNPPKNAALWDIRNEISREIEKLGTKAAS